MGLFDMLFGRKREPAPADQGPLRFGDGPAAPLASPDAGQAYAQPGYGAHRRAGQPMSADEQAIARYRYLLQTAPPDQIEQAHAEAFARLTPQQRAMVLQGLSEQLPAHERAALAGVADDPRSMARYATRAEMRAPGTLERAFGPQHGAHGGMGGMMGGMGGMIAGTLLASVAGAFIGTAIADAMLGEFGDPLAEAMPEELPSEEPMADEGFADAGFDDMGGGGFEEF